MRALRWSGPLSRTAFCYTTRMPPRCPICDKFDEECACDPKDRRAAELQQQVDLLASVIHGWRQTVTAASRYDLACTPSCLGGIRHLNRLHTDESTCTCGRFAVEKTLRANRF